MLTIADLLASSAPLAEVSDSPRLDAELLLCHCLEKERSFLRAWPEREVAAAQAEQFKALLARRLAGEPIAHLTGVQHFWTLQLAVTPASLIPRPETELLVEQALLRGAADQALRVLDLGTGTGAIALALASERPQWQITACDRVIAAVELAIANRDALGLGRVQVRQSHWFEAFAGERFDLVVSNPPYIDAADPHLQQGDVRFEPDSALVADEAGLADIRYICQRAPAFLNEHGWLLLEHGYQQAPAVRGCLLDAGLVDVFTARDLAGHDRVSGGRIGPD